MELRAPQVLNIMKNFDNKKGFTLIEIIIVLIIVGVLAAVALPNLYSNIVRSKGGEAVASFGPMKAQIEACGYKNGLTYAACTTHTLGSEGNFFYELGASTCASLGTTTSSYGDATGWCIYASSPNSTHSAVNYIVLNRNSATSIVCTGYGSFSGIC